MPATSEIDSLVARHAVGHAVAFETSPLGGVVVRLRFGVHEAVVALQGAQVLSWRHDGREMLWLSPAARLGTGKAVRGGIPVCWPWFGPHPREAAKPAHGFVRAATWNAAHTEASSREATVVLQYRPQRFMQEHEPELRLRVALSEELNLTLTTDNYWPVPFTMTAALHTYFAVSDIGEIAVEGLDGRVYVDKLDHEQRKTQAGAITIDREVDRIYLGDTSDISMVDRSTGRRLRIESSGSRSAVVWNPWTEKTQRLGDMGAPDAYRRMLCIETANAGDDTVIVPPNGQHVVTARFRVA